jgi:hypothetical protein
MNQSNKLGSCWIKNQAMKPAIEVMTWGCVKLPISILVFYGTQNIYIYEFWGFQGCKFSAYEVWQKSNETDFLLSMNFIVFTNQGYPLQNSSLGQLHSDGGVRLPAFRNRVFRCKATNISNISTEFTAFICSVDPAA